MIVFIIFIIIVCFIIYTSLSNVGSNSDDTSSNKNKERENKRSFNDTSREDSIARMKREKYEAIQKYRRVIEFYISNKYNCGETDIYVNDSDIIIFDVLDDDHKLLREEAKKHINPTPELLYELSCDILNKNNIDARINKLASGVSIRIN